MKNQSKIKTAIALFLIVFGLNFTNNAKAQFCVPAAGYNIVNTGPNTITFAYEILRCGPCGSGAMCNNATAWGQVTLTTGSVFNIPLTTFAGATDIWVSIIDPTILVPYPANMFQTPCNGSIANQSVSGTAGSVNLGCGSATVF